MIYLPRKKKMREGREGKGEGEVGDSADLEKRKYL